MRAPTGRPLPSAVLLDGNDGALRIARVLVARGVRVHVLAREHFGYVAFSRGVEGRVLPQIETDPSPWLEELERIALRGTAVVISASDPGTELLCRERTRLDPRLLSFESADSAHLPLMGKVSTQQLAEAAGVRVPWKHDVTSQADAERVAGLATYPCISKPAMSHVGRWSGGHRTRLAQTRRDLIEELSRAVGNGVGMLVTEYVPGGEENLEGAVTVRAADGSWPLVYGRRKVRQYPLDFGAGSLHRSAQVPEAIEMARTLLSKAGFVGLSILEAKRHSRTGERVLIEVNVRVPQGFGLGDACGVDASWRLYASLAGLPLEPQPRQRDDVQAVLPLLEMRAAPTRVARGDISIPDLVRSYRRTREFGVLDPRDPRPGLAAARLTLGKVGRWLKQRSAAARGRGRG